MLLVLLLLSPPLLIVEGFLADDVTQQRIVDTSDGVDFVKAFDDEQNPSKVVGSRQM